MIDLKVWQDKIPIAQGKKIERALTDAVQAKSVFYTRDALSAAREHARALVVELDKLLGQT